MWSKNIKDIVIFTMNVCDANPLDSVTSTANFVKLMFRQVIIMHTFWLSTAIQCEWLAIIESACQVTPPHTNSQKVTHAQVHY